MAPDALVRSALIARAAQRFDVLGDGAPDQWAEGADDVLAGSPARAAGLEAGDLLLRAGANTLYGIDDLQRSLVFSSGADVELELVRSDARTRVSVRGALPTAA